jgi:Ca-activated chloride channel family protein
MAAPFRRVSSWAFAFLLIGLVGCGATPSQKPAASADGAGRALKASAGDRAESPLTSAGQAARYTKQMGAKPQADGVAGMMFGGAPVVEGGLLGIGEPATNEKYATFEDNSYQGAVANPISTFSTDVNTASYSNLRRYLDSGKLPPKDAVRIAEMVNYFPYEYPNPKGGDPVAFTTDLAPCPWQPKHHLARIGLKAKVIEPSEMPSRNLVFLVDVSGSMDSPNKLPLVQKSLHMLVNRLTERDVVSIVTYAGDTSVRLPATRGDQKVKIVTAIDGLKAGGSTHGSSGIQMAYDQARGHFIEHGVNRVILCTDGDFNVGITDADALKKLIEKERNSGVFLTVLGYGMGNLKDATLETLANHGNGHYAYIDHEAEAHKVFIQQGGALAVVAKDVKLQVHFNPTKVQAYRLIGYENRMLKTEDFKNDAKDAGDMGSGHTVTAFYEIVPVGVKFDLPQVDPAKYTKPAVPNEAAKSGEWLTVKMRYKHPADAKSLELSAALPGDALGKPVSEDFRFAAAVAEFGMLLRDSPHKGEANYDRVVKEATATVGDDTHRHRNQFVELVKLAQKAGK